MILYLKNANKSTSLSENLPIIRNSVYSETTEPIERTPRQTLGSFFRLCSESEEEELLASNENNSSIVNESVEGSINPSSSPAIIQAEIHQSNGNINCFFKF